MLQYHTFQCYIAGKPFVTRARTSPAPGPVSVTGLEGEHEVELLLNRQLVRTVLSSGYLVRWRGYTSAEDSDTWLLLDELALCPGKVAEYDAAAPRRRTARRIARSGCAGPVLVPAPPPPDAVQRHAASGGASTTAPRWAGFREPLACVGFWFAHQFVVCIIPDLETESSNHINKSYPLQ